MRQPRLMKRPQRSLPTYAIFGLGTVQVARGGGELTCQARAPFVGILRIEGHPATPDAYEWEATVNGRAPARLGFRDACEAVGLDAVVGSFLAGIGDDQGGGVEHAHLMITGNLLLTFPPGIQPTKAQRKQLAELRAGLELALALHRWRVDVHEIAEGETFRLRIPASVRPGTFVAAILTGRRAP